jgi:hypothetical protein
MKTLQLLSDSLPLALDNIGRAPQKQQETFWDSFSGFDRMSDLSSLCEGQGYPSRAEDMREVLEQWREIVECRISKPSGSLE